MSLRCSTLIYFSLICRAHLGDNRPLCFCYTDRRWWPIFCWRATQHSLLLFKHSSNVCCEEISLEWDVEMRLVRQTTSSIKGKYVDYSQNMRHNQRVSLVSETPSSIGWKGRYALTKIIGLRIRIRIRQLFSSRTILIIGKIATYYCKIFVLHLWSNSSAKEVTRIKASRQCLLEIVFLWLGMPLQSKNSLNLHTLGNMDL